VAFTQSTRYHLALAQINHGEAPRRLVASNDYIIVADREPDGLHAQIVLIGPEPGHSTIWQRLRSDRLGHRCRLVIGVLQRFETDDSRYRGVTGCRFVPVDGMVLNDRDSELTWSSSALGSTEVN
jgi:hypothetical protein